MRRGAGYLADAMKAAAGAVVGGAVAVGKAAIGISGAAMNLAGNIIGGAMNVGLQFAHGLASDPLGTLADVTGVSFFMGGDNFATEYAGMDNGFNGEQGQIQLIGFMDENDGPIDMFHAVEESSAESKLLKDLAEEGYKVDENGKLVKDSNPMRDLMEAGENIFSTAEQKQAKLDKEYFLKDAYYTLKMQESYGDKNVSEVGDNPNNIISYTNGSSLYEDKIGYYNAVLHINGTDIETELASGKHLYIAEQDKGADVVCTDPDNVGVDRYDDRITQIYRDANGNIVIDEYNRANVDTSQHYPEVRSGANKPIAAGEYDFIVGQHQGYKALMNFKIENAKEYYSSTQKQ